METGRRYGNVRWELEYVWWTPPESFKARSSVRLLIWLNIAKVLIRVVGPVKVLPAPSYYSWCCPSTDRGPMDLGGAWKSREGWPDVPWYRSWDGYSQGLGGGAVNLGTGQVEMRGISWICMIYLCKLLIGSHVLLSCKYLLYDINDLHG